MKNQLNKIKKQKKGIKNNVKKKPQTKIKKKNKMYHCIY